MRNLIRNLAFSQRMLRKSPGFVVTVIATLALGIGANTAIFTVVYSTLLAPMPYPQPDQLVMVWSKIQGEHNGISAGDYLDWKQQSHVFQELSAFSGGPFNLAGKDAPEIVQGRKATPGMYRMMGTPMLYGRDFLPEEGQDGRDRVVILNNKLWRRLGADPHIVGKQIQLDSKGYTVVGVFQPGQADRLNTDLIVPLVFKPEQINHDFHWLLVMGRLKPGVTMQQAQSDMDAVTAHIALSYPKSNKGWGSFVEPLKNDFMPKETTQTLWILLAAVGFVLLIACVNVANLLMAKGTTRQREVAIRSSLGATRRDVFLQFVTESLSLALVGGAIGVGVGFAMLQGLIAVMPDGTLPSEAELRLNLPILLFALGATTFSGLLFGCLPAWYATRVDPAEFLKEGGRSGTSMGRHWLRRILVMGEFTLALALLAGAGLAMHSFWNLTRVDLGVKTDHVLTFTLNLPDGKLTEPERISGYYQEMLRSIRATSGVTAAAAVVGMPLEGTGFGMPFTIAGKSDYADPSQRPGAGFQMVTSEYFKTFGIRVVKGRSFTDDDNASSLKVAMVNEAFAKKFFPGTNPVGQRLMVEQLIPGVTKLGPYQAWQIVGVFHDVRGGQFRRQREEIDIPFLQIPWPGAGIGVRTTGDPAAMTRTIAAAVHAVDPTIALADLKTLEQIRNDALAGDKFILLLYAGFAAIALLLAAVGIYGVMAFAVGQRTHEIGLRMALGASRERVVRMVMQEGLVQAAVGLGLGLISAYFVGRAMQSTLYGVGALDLTAFCAVSLLLLAAAMLACYFPARRAASVEPMQSLRNE